MLSRNVAGQTKKSVCIALNFCSWAAGNAIGPQVFLKWDAPRYFIAFSTHIGCYALLVLILLLLRWHLSRQNKLRDRIAAEGVSEAADEHNTHAFEDLTDQRRFAVRGRREQIADWFIREPELPVHVLEMVLSAWPAFRGVAVAL